MPGGESDGTCDACKVIGSDCSYGDRERYQSTQIQRFDRPSTSSSASASSDLVSPVYPSQTQASDDRTRKRKASTADDIARTPLIASQFGLPTETPKPYVSQHLPFTSYTRSISSGPSTVPMSPATSLPLSEPVPAPKLERITVPFFRYFGPTANTPGYRKIKVR